MTSAGTAQASTLHAPGGERPRRRRHRRRPAPGDAALPRRRPGAVRRRADRAVGRATGSAHCSTGADAGLAPACPSNLARRGAIRRTLTRRFQAALGMPPGNGCSGSGCGWPSGCSSRRGRRRPRRAPLGLQSAATIRAQFAGPLSARHRAPTAARFAQADSGQPPEAPPEAAAVEPADALPRRRRAGARRRLRRAAVPARSPRPPPA